MRKLCTIHTEETATLAFVKDEIVRKNESIMIKNLFIKPEQCSSQLIKILINDCDREVHDSTTLKERQMTNGG